MDEKGIVKFRCNWVKAGHIEPHVLGEINPWRDRLHGLGLIGVYENGVGFGNISLREGGEQGFVITGSGTGQYDRLDGSHYTRVVEFDFIENSLTCRGPVGASSESLTHGAVYTSDPEVFGVIHVHHGDLWEALLGSVPTTSMDAEYGTPEMAWEVMRLFRETDVRRRRLFVMGGHREGIVSFGRDLKEAWNALMAAYSR